MNELINNLREKIKEAEEYQNNNGKFKNTFYFKTSLASAKGTLAGIDNPPKGRAIYYPDTHTIENLIFKLDMSMKTAV